MRPKGAKMKNKRLAMLALLHCFTQRTSMSSRPFPGLLKHKTDRQTVRHSDRQTDSPYLFLSVIVRVIVWSVFVAGSVWLILYSEVQLFNVSLLCFYFRSSTCSVIKRHWNTLALSTTTLCNKSRIISEASSDVSWCAVTSQHRS